MRDTPAAATAPAGSAEKASSGTLATSAYLRLREEIITGRLTPGRRLHIRQLCDRFGMGLSPMREALNRLSAEGLLRQQDQRGFATAPLDLEDLAELTRSRRWLNELALRHAIADGDAAWEEALLLAHHRLQRTPRYSNAVTPGAYDPDWERAHRAFHSALLAGCRSRWIRDFCEQLFDAADRYRFISRIAPADGRRADESEHKAILDAALARDADRAVALLDEHVTRTETLVRAALADRE